MFHNWSDKNLYNFPGDAFSFAGLLSGIDDRKQNFSLFIVVMSTDINHWSSGFFRSPDNMVYVAFGTTERLLKEFIMGQS